VDGIRLTRRTDAASIAVTIRAAKLPWRGLLMFASFTALAIHATWPFALHPRSTLTTAPNGDIASSVAKWMTIVREGANPFLSGKLHTVAWPIGIQRTPGLEWAGFIASAFLWLGSLTIGPVAAHGLEGVLGYVLTGVVTAAFVRRVTGSLGAGFIAGVGYAFFPHMRAMTFVAPTYAQMWMFILPIWAFWSLAQRPSTRAALIAGLAYLPAMWLTPYYALHAFVVSVTCLVVFLAMRSRASLSFRQRLSLTPLVVAPWLVSTAAYVGIGVLTAFKGVPPRPIQDAYDQASHPLMFVVPGFGQRWPSGTDEWLVRHVPRAAGTNLYVGLSVLALGLVGVVSALAAWRRLHVVTPQIYAAALASSVVFTTFLCSLPPRVAGGRIPTPNLLIVTIVPSLRAGQRFVMPLAAGIAVLAGLGAATLLRRLPRPAVLPAVLLLAATVYVDTDAHYGPFVRLPGRDPALAVLARQPLGPAIHYSGEELYPGETQRSCFLQTQFQKPLVSACGIQLTPLPLQTFDLATHGWCEGMRDMRDLYGLRYVIVERSDPRAMSCFDKHRIKPFSVVSADRLLKVFDLRPGAPALPPR
jgi:hypothetical protein